MQATIRSSLLPQLKERSDSGGGTGRQTWLVDGREERGRLPLSACPEIALVRALALCQSSNDDDDCLTNFCIADAGKSSIEAQTFIEDGRIRNGFHGALFVGLGRLTLPLIGAHE